MKLIFGVIFVVSLLTGCGGSPAIIVDLTSEKVVVQESINTSEESVIKKAREGCQLHGKQNAINLSYTCKDEYCFTKRNYSGAIPINLGHRPS